MSKYEAVQQILVHYRQFFMGFGFGLGAGVVTIVIICLYAKMMTVHITLLGEIIGALMGSYVGMLVGIVFDGFKYLKQHDFLRFLLQSVGGSIIGLTVFVKIILPFGSEIFSPLINCLLVALPLAGAVFGFNFGLTPRKK